MRRSFNFSREATVTRKHSPTRGGLISRALTVASLLLVMVGCGNRYHKLTYFFQNGYVEKQLAGDQYLVSYRGVHIDFCKAAAYYRVAELCTEKEFSYFTIKSHHTIHDFSPKLEDTAWVDPSSASVTEDSDAVGLEKGGAVGYNYMAVFYKSDPGQGAENAVEFLKKTPRPGKE
jgi:hypothetical protein